MSDRPTARAAHPATPGPEADPSTDTAVSADADAAVRAWRMLRSLVLESGDTRARITEALGMSYFRAKALRHIAREGPLTLSALAAALYADAPYTTVSVEHLVRRGLVTRDPNPADRRSKLVSVTAEGAAAAAEMTRLSDTPPPALRALPPEDLAALEHILRRTDQR